MIESYYYKADCCLLVYDITDKKSFKECIFYYKDKIKELCKKILKLLYVEIELIVKIKELFLMKKA